MLLEIIHESFYYVENSFHSWDNSLFGFYNAPRGFFILHLRDNYIPSFYPDVFVPCRKKISDNAAAARLEFSYAYKFATNVITLCVCV